MALLFEHKEPDPESGACNCLPSHFINMYISYPLLFSFTSYNYSSFTDVIIWVRTTVDSHDLIKFFWLPFCFFIICPFFEILFLITLDSKYFALCLMELSIFNHSFWFYVLCFEQILVSVIGIFLINKSR